MNYIKILSDVVSIYHERKNIAKNDKMCLGYSCFCSKSKSTIVAINNHEVHVQIHNIKRKRYSTVKISLNYFGERLEVTKTKDSITGKIGDNEIGFGLGYDEFFNFIVQNHLTISYDEYIKISKVFSEINHNITIQRSTDANRRDHW